MFRTIRLVSVCLAMFALAGVAAANAQVQCQDPSDCDDGNSCTQNRCVNGSCVHPDRPPGTACTSDDNECTRDLCIASVSGGPSACQHISVPAGSSCSDDGNPCTTEFCVPNPSGGASTCAHQPAMIGTPCPDDGNECTREFCATGPSGSPACIHEPLSIGTPCNNDGNECTREFCATDVSGRGTCVHEPLMNGTPCTTDANDCTVDICLIESSTTSCRHLPLAAGNSCDDGSRCTQYDACDSSGHCLGTSPPQDCRQAAKSSLRILNNERNSRDLVDYKWLRGDATALSEFGDPTLDTSYTFCVFDAVGALRMSADVDAGGTCGDDPCWTAKRKGYLYKHKLRLGSGIGKMSLKEGLAGKAGVQVSGKGNFLAVPLLPLAEPVTVRVVNDDTGVCFVSTFTTAKKNTTKAYQAKNP